MTHNGGRTESGCIHELFEHQVEILPRQVALKCGGESVTYQDLNARANRLAAFLRKRLTQPEPLIGVCLSISIDAVVSVLAIMKSGAAYVPLSTQDPFQRIAEIIEETKLSVVLTSLDFYHMVSDSDLDVIALDDNAHNFSAESAENAPVALTPDNLAYVSFTSGSTGRPKGILATHRSVANGLAEVPFHPGDVCGLSTPLSSGFSVSRIFLPLLSGNTLVILPESEAAVPERLVKAIERESITSIGIVTPVMREILKLDMPVSSHLSGIRTLTVGGASVSPALASEIVEALPDATLNNGYATSEIGGAAIIWEMRGGRKNSEGSGGRPFANTAVYILDENLEPVPQGSTGEIYVSAPGLTRGYLNHPGLTAERFLADPLSDHPGGRMYKTGDLGKQRADGLFEVLGRSDDQVKIRGFRVELGEVETVLREHPFVREVAVVAHASGEDARLTAYIVPQDELFSIRSIRDFISERLPSYMAPSFYVPMEGGLPRTTSGKVDRTRLLPPDPAHASLDSEYEPPESEAEEILSEIWSELLGIDRIGRHDNFLELGGHSLLAAQAVARIRERFGVDFRPEEFLDSATVEGQARALDRLIQGDVADEPLLDGI